MLPNPSTRPGCAWTAPLLRARPKEKSDVEPTLPPALAAARADLTALVAQLAEAQAARGLQISGEEYARAVLHPGLMEVGAVGCGAGEPAAPDWLCAHEPRLTPILAPPHAPCPACRHLRPPPPAPQVVYEWARGTPFSEITGLTDVMEGSIVRAVVRLDQCCRELMDAARVMGDTALFQKMAAASAAIKRDVVFAASLYVS
jgi:antiviral helicase SKI2